MSDYGCVSTYLDTYLALRHANEAERKQRERERQVLLNTMALAEAELAKPEYFGFLIERDRMGYLEALSKTKTTFRGINPHDPLNGIVANGGINPDFVMMLEKNFFKENSENLDRDELYFVRYQAERNKLIGWLQSQFKELAIDDEYLRKELGVSQEELFQNLMSNSLVFTTKVENGELVLLDTCSYLDGVKNQSYTETIPQKNCIKEKSEVLCKNFNFLIRELEGKRRKESAKQLDSDRKRSFFISLGVLFFFIVLFSLFFTK